MLSLEDGMDARLASCRVCMPEHVLQLPIVPCLVPTVPICATAMANHYTGDART